MGFSASLATHHRSFITFEMAFCHLSWAALVVPLPATPSLCPLLIAVHFMTYPLWWSILRCVRRIIPQATLLVDGLGI